MITIEDKLDIFYKLVFKNEEEKAQERLENIEIQHKRILNDKIVELEKMKEQNINRRKNLAQIQKNEMISKAIGEDKRKLLIKREELLKDLISSLEIKAKEFTSTIEYREYMLKRLKDTLKESDEKDIIIKLNKEDSKKLQKELLEVAKEFNENLSFEELNKDAIGGFVITDKAKTYSLDNSFKSIIEENRYKIGKELYTSLEKIGDLNE
ncbi:V-type ATP synthase subunit E [Tissierella creatinophila]|uniref:V-type proton ATPase subunit E n=1 Tax=Tissierella creatinophila DSM 6911 TaxID=1123403 RepID=A0A1U7M8V1_TISCR|nr:V-type ATP synthase subunit E [Tissierella creatinophila]OLS03639.1 V-type proton ATPase subunit E [Tissierella creatinophila DSM 6911]